MTNDCFQILIAAMGLLPLNLSHLQTWLQQIKRRLRAVSMKLTNSLGQITGLGGLHRLPFFSRWSGTGTF
jgi:hypothetical protein